MLFLLKRSLPCVHTVRSAYFVTEILFFVFSSASTFCTYYH